MKFTSVTLLASSTSALLVPPNLDHVNPFQSPLLNTPPLYLQPDDTSAPSDPSASWLENHLSSLKESVKTTVDDALDQAKDRFEEINVGLKHGAENIRKFENGVWKSANEFGDSLYHNLKSTLEEYNKPRKGHHGHHHHGGYDLSNYTVYELIKASNHTTKFAALVDEQDELVSLLKDTKANYTLFVPTDKAFENIPDDVEKPSKEVLAAILKYHVAPGTITAKDLIHKSTIGTTLEEKFLGAPQRLKVTAGWHGIKLNFYGKVIAADFKGKNGYVHAVDHIIVPPPFAGKSLSLFPTLFSTLLHAYEVTDFVKYIHAVKTTGSTVFAPTNKAWEKLGPKLNAYLFNTETGKKHLNALLKYHIVANATLYSDHLDDHTEAIKSSSGKHSEHYELKTLLEGASVGVDIHTLWLAKFYVVNGKAHAFIPDGVAKNGVIQTIDNILIPPNPHKQDEDDIFNIMDWEDMSIEEFTERLDPYIKE